MMSGESSTLPSDPETPKAKQCPLLYSLLAQKPAEQVKTPKPPLPLEVLFLPVFHSSVLPKLPASGPYDKSTLPTLEEQLGYLETMVNNWNSRDNFPLPRDAATPKNSKMHYRKYTEYQTDRLKECFALNRWIGTAKSKELAQTTGLSKQQVQKWFENHRTAEKKQKLRKIKQFHNSRNTSKNS